MRQPDRPHDPASPALIAATYASRGRLLSLAAALAAAAFLTAGPAVAETPWTIDEDASVFAVVTHKAGVAARLAHNHLVVARGGAAELSFDPEAPGKTSFAFEAPAGELMVDDSAEQTRWYPRLAELGLLEEAFSEISDKDRGKIHEAMVGRKQLDVSKHPKLAARVASVEKSSGDHPWTVELALEVVGKEVTKPVQARFELSGDRLMVEAYGEFRFTDFGIKPYSALLGAIRNDDPFHVFLHLEATRPPAAAPGEATDGGAAVDGAGNLDEGSTASGTSDG